MPVRSASSASCRSPRRASRAALTAATARGVSCRQRRLARSRSRCVLGCEGAGAGGGGAGDSAFGSSFFGSSFFGDTTSGSDAASVVSFMRSSLVYVMGSEEAEPSPSSMLSARGATSEAGRADRGLAAMAGAIAARRVEIETREGALGRTCARVDATSAMRCGAGRVFCRRCRASDVGHSSARATVTQNDESVEPTSRGQVGAQILSDRG